MLSPGVHAGNNQRQHYGMSEQKTRTLISRPRGLTREQQIEWEALLDHQPPQDDGTPAPWRKGAGRTALLAELARMYSEATGQRRKDILETWIEIRELTRNVVPFRRREPQQRHPDAPPGNRIPLIKRMYGDENGGAFLGASFTLQLFQVDLDHIKGLQEYARTGSPEDNPMEVARGFAMKYREELARTKHGHPDQRVERLAREIMRHHTQKALARMIGLEREFLEYIKTNPIRTWQALKPVSEGKGTYTLTRVPGHLADNTYQRGEVIAGQLDLFTNNEKLEVHQRAAIRRTGAELTGKAYEMMLHLFQEFDAARRDRKDVEPERIELKTGIRELARALGMDDRNGSSIEQVRDALTQLCVEPRAWVWKERADPGKRKRKATTETHRTFGTIFVIEEVFHDNEDGTPGRLKYFTLRPSEIMLAQRDTYYMAIPPDEQWRPGVEEALAAKLTERQAFFFRFLLYRLAKARTDKSKNYRMFTERRLEIHDKWQDIAGGMHISEDVISRKKGEALAQIRAALDLSVHAGYVLEYSMSNDGDVRYVIDMDKIYAMNPGLVARPPTNPAESKGKKRRRKSVKEVPPGAVN
jgi:hypothetical protein